MSTMDVIFPASPMLLYTQVRTLLLCIVVTGTNMCMCGVLGPCVCVYGVYGVLWLGLPKFPVLHTNTPTIIIHIPFYHLYAPIPPYARPYIPLLSIPALVVHPHIPVPSIPALHTPYIHPHCNHCTAGSPQAPPHPRPRLCSQRHLHQVQQPLLPSPAWNVPHRQRYHRAPGRRWTTQCTVLIIIIIINTL